MCAIRRICSGGLAAGLACAALAGPSGVAPGAYHVTRETVLPHLEEALRYATTRETLCLSTQPADVLFPLLEHPAFAGCTLQPAPAPADAAGVADQHWALHCSNAGAASGEASLRTEPGRFTAVLQVKMGGKNMTLSQRVQGARRGGCDGAPGR